MPRRNTTKKLGRRTALTPERAQAILTIVEDGNHYTTACAATGIAKSTLFRWIERGENCAQAIAEGKPHNPDDLPFMEFRDKLALARARAEMTAVKSVRTDMVGGFVLSEEPVVNDNGEAQYDENGEVLWKRTYAKPDGRLAMAYLARSSPSTWGEKATRIELVAPDGTLSDGAQEDSGGKPSEGAAALAERLALVAAQRAAGEDEVDEPVDGEFVEDD